MSKFIISLLFCLSATAYAESLTWRVGTVRGMIEPQGQLTLESAQARMLCHYCTWGTCAGGPTYATDLATQLTAQSPSKYHILIEPGSHKVTSLNSKLHSCSYRIDIAGRDGTTGRFVTGSILLAYSTKRAANPIWYDEMLSQGLTEILMERPLRVEVQKLGLSEPEIYPLDNVPYFDGK